MSHFDKTMGVRKANLIIHIQITDSVVRHKAEALTVSLPSTSYSKHIKIYEIFLLMCL